MSDGSPDDASRRMFGFFLAAAIGLFVLALLVVISLVYVRALLVMVGVAGFLFVHYITWGWWLGGYLRRHAASEDAET